MTADYLDIFCTAKTARSESRERKNNFTTLLVSIQFQPPDFINICMKTQLWFTYYFVVGIWLAAEQ